MSPDSQPTLTPQAAVGVVLALLGVIFTLDNLGLADTEHVLRYWPVAVIAVGVAICMQAAQTRDWIFGIVWMIGGSVLLAWNLSWITFHPKKLLPLLLVAIGARLIWRGPSKPKPAPVQPPPIPAIDMGYETPSIENPGWQEPSWQSPPPTPSSAGYASSTGGSAAFTAGSSSSSGWTTTSHNPGRVTMFAILSGVERRLRSAPFAGGELTAIMGGCELDLREALIQGEEVHIAAFALWGGIEIRVPKDWMVVNESVALMGGVEDATRPPVGPGRPRLVVKGFALMGGIEIRN
jgi:predicted membrane protein